MMIKKSLAMEEMALLTPPPPYFQPLLMLGMIPISIASATACARPYL